jgi:hypothetical protein
VKVVVTWVWSVFVGVGVSSLDGVEVNKAGVDDTLVTPIMTGVWVKMEGVGVMGKNGVGGSLGSGWMTQPLQDVSRNTHKRARSGDFILSPHDALYPASICPAKHWLTTGDWLF